MFDERFRAEIDAQRGVFARYQLIRELGRHRADGLIKDGVFDRFARASYRAHGGVRLPEQAAFAAALRSRPNATITGPLVLHLLGIPGFTGVAPFEVLVQPGRSLTNVGFRWRVDLDPTRPVTWRGDVRTVGPIDALIDSAPFRDEVGDRAIRVAWDHLRWDLDQRVDRLERRLEQLRGLTAGVEVLEAILAVGGGAAVEGEGERKLSPVVACFDPPFEPQVWVTPRRRPDFFNRRCLYALDYLGDVDHAHVAARIADDERDQELRQEGIRTSYVTAADLREPVTLVGRIAASLTVRAHELGVVPPVARRAPELP